jgi:hypothetical protein
MLRRRILRRIWRLALLVGVAAAALVVGARRPWHDAGSAPPAELRVERATLQAGRIVLVLVNWSEERTRIAQVILNDAFVDFHTSLRSVSPGDTERITVSYPWVRGESYDIQLMTSTGATIDYEIEEAEPGSQTAQPA